MNNIDAAEAVLLARAVKAVSDLHDCPEWVIVSWIRVCDLGAINNSGDYPTRAGVVQFDIGGNKEMVVRAVVKLVNIFTGSNGLEIWICSAVTVFVFGDTKIWVESYDIDIKTGKKLDYMISGPYPYQFIQL